MTIKNAEALSEWTKNAQAVLGDVADEMARFKTCFSEVVGDEPTVRSMDVFEWSAMANDLFAMLQPHVEAAVRACMGG